MTTIPSKLHLHHDHFDRHRRSNGQHKRHTVMIGVGVGTCLLALLPGLYRVLGLKVTIIADVVVTISKIKIHRILLPDQHRHHQHHQ